jgi:hypothetical protein
MMTRNRRLWFLLLCGIAVVALILLAAGLPQLEFSPGYDLPRSGQEEEPFTPAGLPPGSKIFEYLYIGLYIAALVLLPFAIVYLVLSREARKRVLSILGFLLWLVAFFLLMRARPEPFQQLEERPTPQVLLEESAATAVDFSATPPGAPPGWLVWVASLGLALLIAVVLVGLAWLIWRRRRPSAGSLEQLAREAQRALVELQAGVDLRDAVMRCYFEMSRVLREEQGLRRESAMTPREFEVFLAEKGLPQQRVRTLTRLFEAVRYGAKVPGEREEHQAVDCLAAIIDACTSGT